jgi:hypothetical protein
VVRPKAMEDFCVSVLLETAHVTYTVEEHPPEHSMWVEKLDVKPTFVPKEKVQVINNVPYKVEYYPPAGWKIDTTMGKGGYDFTNVEVTNTTLPQPVVTADLFLAAGSIDANQALKVDITIYLVSNLPFPVQNLTRHLFLTARELCCCPPLHPVTSYWVPYETDLSRASVQPPQGLMSKQAFQNSRRMAAVIREEMIRSFTSSRRQPRGQSDYTDSDAFHTHITDVLRRSKLGDRLRQPLSEVSSLDDATRGALYRVLGQATVGDLLTADRVTLARMLDTDLSKVGKLKAAMLQTIGADALRH